MTQEQLADMLGLTSAAISGWECDRNAPDISQIPQLSQIFGVSADVLLGIDLTAREEKIHMIIENAMFASPVEAVEIYRQALVEFPSSYRLMLFLADSLSEIDNADTYKARLKEQISLYKRIREGSDDLYYKNMAEGRLCHIYLREGKRDEALKIAEGVPVLPYSRTELNIMLKEGIDKIHEMHHNILGQFCSACDDIYILSTQQVDGKLYYTHEQAITMLEKIPKFYEIFYENDDYLGENHAIAIAHFRIAEHYADLKDGKNTVKHIKLAIKHALEYDAYTNGLVRGIYGITDAWGYPQFPMEKRHTSILGDPRHGYPTATVVIDADSDEAFVEQIKKDVTHERFDFVRDLIDAIF